MGSWQPATTAFEPHWRGLFSLFSLSWIPTLFQLYTDVRHWIARERGLYEFLLYDATLELRDAQGHTAIFRKHQRVKFLQDHIIAFEDFAWGEGNIFARYQVTPGVEADRYQEGDRWNVLISLRATKHKGDIEDFHFEREVKNGFSAAEEWQQAEIRHHTRHLKLSILFPKARPCKRATIRLRRSNQVMVLGPEHFHQLPDGRQLLRWETHNVKPLEVFTLRWHW